MKISTNDRKELKQLYTEKRQLITQLFKKLTSIGLSYRKGLLNIHSQYSLSISSIQLTFYPIEFKQNYAFIQTKKTKLFIENRLNTLEKFSLLFQETDLNYYKILYQHNQFHLLAQKNKIDPIIFQRIQGFTEHFINIIFQQKVLLHQFIQQYETFSKTFTIYEKRNFNFQLNQINQIDQLYHLTTILIERIYSILFIIRSSPTNPIEQIPILDRIPNYIQLLSSNDLTSLLEKFLERLNLLIDKLNQFYENVIDYHPLLKDIHDLHEEISLIKEQIRNVMEKVFIDEDIFPNDRFVGQLAKNFMEIYEQFSQINILKKEKG
jgi:hypothetical protein